MSGWTATKMTPNTAPGLQYSLPKMYPQPK